jgi:hypothetical protein
VDDPDVKPTAEVLQTLREAIPEEWREKPLGWDGVEVWEAEHHVTLPEPYRSLIAEICNGSALGPPDDSGLLPLGWFSPVWPDKATPRDEAAPFPLERAWYWETDERPRQEIGPLIDAVFRKGSVALGSDYGGEDFFLITAGPQRGSIWLLSDEGACPYLGRDVDPWTASGPGIGLLDWFAQWQTGLTWFDLS